MRWPLQGLLPAWPGQLRGAGVLGINFRNMNILTRWNPKPLYRFSDDKLATKELCALHGIAVPQTYAVVDHPVQVRRLERLVGSHQEFVVKPARGAGGRGVVIVVARRGEEFLSAGGEAMSASDLRYHLLAILGGNYSIGGRADRAIIERRIKGHPALEAISAGGTADVRIILYRGLPIMAMLRLPTRASAGRSNLHQGAMGVGLDLQTGSATSAVCEGKSVDRHVDSGLPIRDITVPMWPEILVIAQRLAAAVGLGYVGADIILDGWSGPVVLEANGRPGLSIQIANRCGLLKKIAECDTAPDADVIKDQMRTWR